MHFSKIRLVALGCSLDCLIARVPIGRADLAILVCELERIDQAERLVYTSTNGKVIDGNL
jgi:hypothetical protein